jgi:hypothetical protein
MPKSKIFAHFTLLLMIFALVLSPQARCFAITNQAQKKASSSLLSDLNLISYDGILILLMTKKIIF